MSTSPRRSESGGSLLGPRLNLDNFLDNRILNGRILTSPRSIEICNSHGVRPEELLPRPLESFQSGGAPRALVQRRFEHFEQKRANTLAFLRERRRELIANPPPPESPLSRASTPRVGSPRSSGRCSSQRNRDLQQRNYEEREAERADKFSSISRAATVAIAKAEIARAQHQEEVRQRGERRWDEVQQHHEHAKQLEAAQRDAKADKMLDNELKRETSKAAVNTARSWRSSDLSKANSKAIAQAQQRAKSKEAERREKGLQKVIEVENKAQHAQQVKEQQREEWAARGAQHAEAVDEARERAEQLLDERVAHCCAKLTTKQQRYEQQREALAAEERAKQEALEREHERFDETVGRAKAVEEARKELRRTKSFHKDVQFLTRREQQELEALLERENRREKVEDHIEIVTRMRRAREYQRDKYLRSKYLGQQ